MRSKDSYDIFISYAHEDAEWVREQLYRPLLQCRTADGRSPVIFLDTGDTGVKVGQSFVAKIQQAIQASRYFVPVYSKAFFASTICGNELEMAWLQKMNADLVVSPLLIDPWAGPLIPLTWQATNYQSTDSGNWFDRLCAALNLTRSPEELHLHFMDAIEDTPINHTLPEVRVQLQGSDSQEKISLELVEGELQGTTAVETKGGIARFADLSVGAARANARLAAHARGATCLSSEFAVTPARAQPASQPCIGSRGEAFFFEDSRAILVMDRDRLSSYDLTGQPLWPEPVSLADRVRVLRREGSRIALADWSGRVYLLDQAGPTACWDLCDSRLGFDVPADVALAGSCLYAGFWNGRIYQLSAGRKESLYLRHEPGVQALAVAGGRLYVCGLDGRLSVYNEERRLACPSSTLEESILALRAYQDCLVVVGERRVYQIPLHNPVPIPEELFLMGVAAAFAETALPVLIDRRGKGMRVNSDLRFESHFVTQAGACPIAADNAGRYCVFLNSDGSRTLMVDGRIAFSHSAGTLTVAPAGGSCALGDAQGIQLLDVATLLDGRRK